MNQSIDNARYMVVNLDALWELAVLFAVALLALFALGCAGAFCAWLLEKLK